MRKGLKISEMALHSPMLMIFSNVTDPYGLAFSDVKSNFKLSLPYKLFYLSPPSFEKTYICIWRKLLIRPKMIKARRAYFLHKHRTLSCVCIINVVDISLPSIVKAYIYVQNACYDVRFLLRKEGLY